MRLENLLYAFSFIIFGNIIYEYEAVMDPGLYIPRKIAFIFYGFGIFLFLFSFTKKK